MTDRVPEGWLSARLWVHGWFYLGLVNLLFLLETPPTSVWFLFNGFSTGLIYLAWWIERRHKRRAR